MSDLKYTLSAVGVICITALLGLIILSGNDGTHLTLVVGAICGIIGAAIGVTIKKEVK